MGDAPTGRAEALLLKDPDPDLKVDFRGVNGCRRSSVGPSFRSPFGAVCIVVVAAGVRWCLCCPMRELRHQPQMPLRRR